jgi:phosphoribosylaminoimidazolecarboxamide formyltransferase / IMP cyclohydrolase
MTAIRAARVGAGCSTPTYTRAPFLKRVESMSSIRPRRALLSVSDKTGLIDFAKGLRALGVELLSTGGTARSLREANIDVTDVSAVTGFPEILDGRVKTLHPKIHGGLLQRGAHDADTLAAHAITPIDLLVVNLYPFEATLKSGASLDTLIEQIDIGGPAMLRAAAKNHAFVATLCDPADYADCVAALTQQRATTLDQRRRWAGKAFAHTARYDGLIANHLTAIDAPGDYPASLSLQFDRREALRYGENPHQSGAFYVERDAPTGTIASAVQLAGKALSFNNIADADAALQCVKAFDAPACVIVKHLNPCGVAVAADLTDAYVRAFATDPTSAFGGILAFNRPLDARTVAAILERQFAEVVLAPSVDPDSLALFGAKPNIRVLATGPLIPLDGARDLRRVEAGLLVQPADRDPSTPDDWKLVTTRAPTDAERRDLGFAWKVAMFVKSNAIVFADDQRTIGVGAGQMSRVVSTRIAAMKAADAGLPTAGAVLASDAFFPFRDGLDQAAEHGVRAVIQPGGSLRDAEVIAAANEHGIAMLFTGVRHFRH